MNESLLTPAGLCEKVPGTTVNYWAQQRFLGRGPKFIKMSPRKVLYRWPDVEAWLDASERTSTKEAS